MLTLYFIFPLSEVTIDSQTVQISTGNAALSAIDTGTTLIGGPTADVAAIKAAVNGTDSQSHAGFFNFRTFPVRSWALPRFHR
jgi:cathepsin D